VHYRAETKKKSEDHIARGKGLLAEMENTKHEKGKRRSDEQGQWRVSEHTAVQRGVVSG